jgi:hypothetical protein
VFAMAVSALGGCRKAGSHAEGSGYGAGIARVSWTFGNGTRGASTQGVSAPTEAEVGRIKSPAAAAGTQAGRP